MERKSLAKFGRKKKLQFTTSDEISKLKTILGSAITVSVNNGFPTAPKRIKVADTYLFSSQTATESEFVNAIIPQDILGSNRPNGFFFLWCEDTEKLRVTLQWGKFRITHEWVRKELRGLTEEDSLSSEDSVDFRNGDDFAHECAQFEVTGFEEGDSNVRCTVIESENIDFVVAQYFEFSIEFVREWMKDNF
jgi:hypothetical protein